LADGTCRVGIERDRRDGANVGKFRDATNKEECRSDCLHALQALWKALDRAEELIQN
jgi:hypothetical protein